MNTNVDAICVSFLAFVVLTWTKGLFFSDVIDLRSIESLGTTWTRSETVWQRYKTRHLKILSNILGACSCLVFRPHFISTLHRYCPCTGAFGITLFLVFDSRAPFYLVSPSVLEKYPLGSIFPCLRIPSPKYEARVKGSVNFLRSSRCLPCQLVFFIGSLHFAIMSPGYTCDTRKRSLLFKCCRLGNNLTETAGNLVCQHGVIIFPTKMPNDRSTVVECE